jgi:hypothetical protein
MGRDELKQPLRKRSLMQRLWARRPSLLAVTATLIIAGYGAGSAWLLKQPMPFAGEPILTAQIPPPEKLKTVASAEEQSDSVQPAEPGTDPDQLDTASIDNGETPPDDSQFVEPETKKKRGSDEVNIQTSSRRPLRPAPVEALTEISAEGKLPRIGPGNMKPMEVYARTTPLGILHSDKPKIAIVLGGMGLNEKLTQQAMRSLPGDITFAFAPYGSTLQDQVDAARAEGHEVLLQLPMEPIGYPVNNPGPRTLLAEADAETNLESLRWHMSRFAGYTGVINYLGGRMLASAPALTPVLSEIQKRGLLYLEDGSSTLTASQDIAKKLKLPNKRGQIVIDAEPSREAIMAALELLENEAQANGMAIGTGSGLAITTETVRDWAETLAEKGILLVPVSAVYKGRLG